MSMYIRAAALGLGPCFLGTSSFALRACHCELDAHSPSWRDLAESSRCWNVGRKIPPQLFAAAVQCCASFVQTGDFAVDPPSVSILSALPVSFSDCLPGAFTALLILLLMWEAHDAPPHLLGTGLAIATELRNELATRSTVVEETLDCKDEAVAFPSSTWPGVLRLSVLERVRSRLARKAAVRLGLASGMGEPWHVREVAEHTAWSTGEAMAWPTQNDRSLCLCILHGEGAATLNATLNSYRVGGLLNLARRRFIVFPEHADDAERAGMPPEPVRCWRERFAHHYALEILPLTQGTWRWPDPFIRQKGRRGGPGAAMVACAERCDAKHILFLEDDWELITKPPQLVQHRVSAAMNVLDQPSVTGKILGVHLRHKLLFGAPFYELLTAAQHNEPPSAFAAWYFSDDAVADEFPDGLWEPPFWDSRSNCDSDRRSWWGALQNQRDASRVVETHELMQQGLVNTSSARVEARVWWCANQSSLLCASTAAHRDPFRSLTHSTNPTLYSTASWRLYLANFAAVLQDSRAVEEAVSSSYMWRVEPSFTVALSLGLFRHNRLDRQRLPADDDVENGAALLCAS